jgi:EmrB/QacA subfamily drug resistance transporter
LEVAVLSSAPTPTARRGNWLAFAAVLAAAVMDLMDTTITQVAGPAIRGDLHGSDALLEWVTAAYTLAMGVGLLTGGRLGDLFGRKRMVLIGIAGFTVASVACAAAASPGELIAARAVQGLFAAAMLPQVFGLIRDLFAAHEMGKAFAVYGPVMGLSAVLGPIAAGGLIDLNLSGLGWRAIFLVNVPVGIAALAAGARLLPAAPASSRPGRLDITGALLAGGAMFLVVFPLAQGHDLGWPGWLIGLLGAAIPVLGAFAWHQVRRQRAGRTPLVERSIFRHRSYSSGVAFTVVFVGTMGGITLTVNVLLQVGLGFSPWHSALTTVPWAGGAFIGSAIGGILMGKLGRRVLQIGLATEAAGLAAVALVLHLTGTSVSTVDLITPMTVGGAGMGMVFVPLFDIIMGHIAPHETGSAAGVLQAVNSLSMTIGVAGIGAIIFGLAGPAGPAGQALAGPAGWTLLVILGLLGAAFALTFQLPKRAREAGSEPASETGGAAAAGRVVAVAAS